MARKVKEITITVDTGRALLAKGVTLTVATLYQTMGPNWKDIVWVQNTGSSNRKPYVSPTHSHKQIEGMI